jgi:outer membrane protein assembly factor BamB
VFHQRNFTGYLIVAAVVSLAADWPQFRGPNGNGLAEESKAPTEWGRDKNVLWKVNVPGVAWSSPIVSGGKVFVTTAITEKQTKPQPGGGFGPGWFGGPPQSGQIMPTFLQDMLQLTAEQKKSLEEFQNEVDKKVGQILTDDQKKQLKEPGPGFGGGPGGRGPGGDRPGGGGPGRFGGPPQPGQIMPVFLQERLKLTAEQKKQVEGLQKEVDSKLGQILAGEQKKRLQEMREGFGRRGPGGFGGPGGGGPGRFGPGGFGGGKPPDVVYRWQVYCLDRDTGKIIWRQLALEGKPRIPIQQSNTYATETPVTDGERIYAYFGMHGLYCYDMTGNLLWKKDLGAYPTIMGQGPASSPVLDGERLFLQIDNEEKSFLVALDKKSGDEVWRVARSERTNHSSPFVWKNNVRTELVTSGNQKVRSCDPASGKLLWELGMGGGACYSTPVGDSERLYVGSESGFMGPWSGGGGLFAVRAGAAGDLTLKEGETSNAGVVWSVSKSGLQKASPLVYQDYVYILSQNGGMVICYDAKTGKQVYRERIPAAGGFWASPWAADGKVFCLDESGTTHVLQAGPEFKVLGKNKLDDMFWASPAVAGGAVILRGVDNLYCIKE